MKVALYASQLAPAVGSTGVHRVVSELARELHALHPHRYRLVSSAEKATPAWLPADMPITRLPGPRRALHLSWYMTRRPRIDRFIPDADLLHVLYPTWPVPTKLPFVYTINDLFPLQHPEWYSKREVRFFGAAVRDAAAHAAKIVVDSAAVAETVSADLGIERSRIKVVHYGVAERFRVSPSDETIKAVCSRFGMGSGTFLLYTGSVSSRKNVATLVRAMARRGPGARLLVAGAPGIGAEHVTAEIERLGLAEEVVMAGFVPDDDLPALMAGALALVLPSEDEGFGLPPLEAMALGTPVIASRAGALPEVLGDAALLLQPRDADLWAEALARVEGDRAYSTDLASRGKAHSLRFTWERAAKETAAVHEEILSA